MTSLRGAAELAVIACLPVLPLNGSLDSSFRVSERIDPVCAATPEEWADAAHAIAELHMALSNQKQRDV